MKHNICLIGCGFAGSLWLEEVLKRLYAIEFFHNVGFTFVDRDTFEARNVCNQMCLPQAIGRPKAYMMEQRARYYGFSSVAVGHGIYNVDNPKLLLEKAGGVTLWVDALDNIETRWIVHNVGILSGRPVMHLGVNKGGSGSVEWVLPNGVDDWHLSPTKVAVLPPKQDEIKDPPCHLVQTRGLGLNLAVAGAKALTLSFGEDLEELFESGPQPGFNVYTGWTATNEGHSLNPEQIHVEAQKE